MVFLTSYPPLVHDLLFVCYYHQLLRILQKSATYLTGLFYSVTMFKGGRPRDPVWQHFLEVTVSGKSFAKCKHCGNQQLPKACRLKQHHDKCARIHTTVEENRPATDIIATATLKRDRSTSPPPVKRQAVSMPVTSTQPSIDNNVIKTSATFQSALDMDLARLIYGCNLPFAIVEHPLFINFMKKARPGYKLPPRKSVAGYLLDRVHDELRDSMKQSLDGKTATLIQDGWSNCHNDPIVASCLQVGDQSYFLDSVATGSMSKTAENCKSLAADSIKTARETYNCKVTSVVTDNAANMAKMRQALKDDDPDLNVYGCSAHLLNLLGEDLTPSAIMKHVKEVNKYFRNHHKPCALLSAHKDSCKPQLPGETRWKSQLLCLDTFIKNRSFYVQISQDHEEEFDKSIIQKIQDFNIFRNVRDLADQLRPIASAIDLCQSDNKNIADACDVWLSLLDNPILAPHKATVKKRFNQAITTEHLVACALHPSYKGAKLSPDQLNVVTEWISSRGVEHLTTFISYQATASPFPRSFFTHQAQSLPPLTWWKATAAFGVPSSFISLASLLLGTPPSSASIERIFSSFGAIHTKIRNRLGNEKTAKLVFCYRMLRGNLDLDY